MSEGQSQQPPRPLLRRRDQAVVAALVLLATVVLAGWWLAGGGHRGGLVEIDRIERGEAPFQVDLNAADWPELAQLPGIGEILARRIVAAREEEGPFRCPEDLVRVHGIGPKTLEAVQPYLTAVERCGEPEE